MPSSLDSKPSTLLITGGAGFIGSNLVRYLLAHTAHRVINVDKLTYAGNLESLREVMNHPRHTFLPVDLCDAAAVRAVFAEHRPDAVLHLAAESHVDRSITGPAPFLQTNVLGTFNLLEAARHHWLADLGSQPSAFRFVHISTDEVFGSLGPGDPAFHETTPYDPRSPYSASKAASDHLVRAWHHTYGLPVIVTNCSNNYGPYQFPEKLIPVVILKALRGEPIPVYGTGENIRDWLHVEDHCSALLAVLERGRVGETYCIGGNHERRNLDLVRTVCRLVDEERVQARKPEIGERKAEGEDQKTARESASQSASGILPEDPTSGFRRPPSVSASQDARPDSESVVRSQLSASAAPPSALRPPGSPAQLSTLNPQPSAALITHVPDRPGHDFRYALDTTKLTRELGWKPHHDFESGLRETVRWYLQNPDWIAAVTKRAGDK